MDSAISNNRWTYIFIVGCGVLLSTMDSSMVNVALPQIMRHFTLDVSRVKLVVLIYLLTITSTLVVWGRVADKFGKGKMYLSGMLLFLAGAVSCAFAGSFSLLIGSRAIQGVGAAMMMSSGPAILKITSSEEHLGKTLGLVGIATSLGLMSGPLISGLILANYSWREVFLVSLPFGLGVVTVGSRYLLSLQELTRRSTAFTDVQGMSLWALLVILYVLLVNGTFTGWYLTAGLLCFLVMLFLVFWKVEALSADPIMPIGLVRKRYYWVGVFTAALSFAALFIVLILMPFYLEYILNYSAAKVGMTMMALPVSLVIMSPLSGWLYDRYGSARYISTVGLVLSSCSVILLSRLSQETSMSSVCLRLLLLGGGQSIFLSPNSASVLSRVEDRYAGITSGILATARNFGMLTGAALAGSIFSYLFQVYSGGMTLAGFEDSYVSTFLLAQQRTFFVALFLLLSGVVLSLLRGQ